jgi:hypothetical protein
MAVAAFARIEEYVELGQAEGVEPGGGCDRAAAGGIELIHAGLRRPAEQQLHVDAGEKNVGAPPDFLELRLPLFDVGLALSVVLADLLRDALQSRQMVLNLPGGPGQFEPFRFDQPARSDGLAAQPAQLPEAVGEHRQMADDDSDEMIGERFGIEDQVRFFADLDDDFVNPVEQLVVPREEGRCGQGRLRLERRPLLVQILQGALDLELLAEARIRPLEGLVDGKPRAAAAFEQALRAAQSGGAGAAVLGNVLQQALHLPEQHHPAAFLRDECEIGDDFLDEQGADADQREEQRQEGGDDLGVDRQSCTHRDGTAR